MFGRLQNLIAWRAALVRVVRCLVIIASMFAPAFIRTSSAQQNFPIDPKTLIEKLIGSNATFSATAQIRGKGRDSSSNFKMTVQYKLLQGMLRTEMNPSKDTDEKHLTSDQLRLRELGLDHMIYVVLPSLKQKYLIFPTVKSYCVVPMTYFERNHSLDNFRIEKLGEEQLDGHPCVHSKVTAMNEFVEDVAADVWQATDLKNFPVKLEFKLKDAIFIMSFTDVKLTDPDFELFQPPQEFQRFPDLGALKQDALKRPH